MRVALTCTDSYLSLDRRREQLLSLAPARRFRLCVNGIVFSKAFKKRRKENRFSFWCSQIVLPRMSATVLRCVCVCVCLCIFSSLDVLSFSLVNSLEGQSSLGFTLPSPLCDSILRRTHLRMWRNARDGNRQSKQDDIATAVPFCSLHTQRQNGGTQCTSNGITNVKERLSCFDKELHVALACQVHKICDRIAQGPKDLETNKDRKARDTGSGIVQEMRTGVHCEHGYTYMCEYICSVFAASLM